MKLDLEIIRYDQDEPIHWTKRGRVAIVITAETGQRHEIMADHDDKIDVEDIQVMIDRIGKTEQS